MPTYLLHGFRWPRPLVRIHIIMQNIDEAAPEWLVAPDTTLALLKNFHELYPECMQHLGRLRFVEQYDPNDISTLNGVSQPFAYVADMVEEVNMGMEVEDVRGRGVDNDQWNAITELRDKVAPEEKVGWYIVVCGDEERAAPPSDGGRNSAVDNSVVASRQSDVQTPSLGNGDQASTSLTQKSADSSAQPEVKSMGVLKRLFSIRLGRRKSRGDLNDSKRSRSKSAHAANREAITEPVPPLPTGVIPTYSDRSSSVPSIPPSAAASTPPPTDEIFELPAMTPSSSHSTPPPSEFNFIPESETQTKYLVTEETPVPEVEPKCANMPPIDPQMRVSARRKSEVPSIGGYRSVVDLRHSTRRHSDLSSFRERAPRSSDTSTMAGRSESPEYKHEFTPGRRVMSFPNVRSGAVSPLTYRSSSPSVRSGAVSPIARSYSPIRSETPGLLNEDELAFARAQRRSTMQIRQQKRQQLSMVNVPSGEAAQQQSSIQDTDEDEEMDEVITMNPAVRAPPKHFLRRSGTASSFMSLSNRSQPAMALDSIVEGEGRAYFGQEVDPKDLVAVNLENAFENL